MLHALASAYPGSQSETPDRTLSSGIKSLRRRALDSGDVETDTHRETGVQVASQQEPRLWVLILPHTDCFLQEGHCAAPAWGCGKAGHRAVVTHQCVSVSPLLMDARTRPCICPVVGVPRSLDGAPTSPGSPAPKPLGQRRKKVCPTHQDLQGLTPFEERQGGWLGDREQFQPKLGYSQDLNPPPASDQFQWELGRDRASPRSRCRDRTGPALAPSLSACPEPAIHHSQHARPERLSCKKAHSLLPLALRARALVG